jgi:hypothetical protein
MRYQREAGSEQNRQKDSDKLNAHNAIEYAVKDVLGIGILRLRAPEKLFVVVRAEQKRGFVKLAARVGC